MKRLWNRDNRRRALLSCAAITVGWLATPTAGLGASPYRTADRKNDPYVRFASPARRTVSYAKGASRILRDRVSLSLVSAPITTNPGFSNGGIRTSAGLAGPINNAGFLWVDTSVMGVSDAVNNTGTIWVGDGSSGGGNVGLDLQNDLSLSGTGEIYFLSTASVVDNQPFLQVTGTVTNGVDHRIHGGNGRIVGPGRFVNEGLVDADTPLRTIRIETAELTNVGNLWARSGNLRISVADWSNEGVVRVAQGSQSTITGTLFTNQMTGVVESVAGSSLSIGANVTNLGRISTDASGDVSITGSNRRVTNLLSGVFEADAGAIRFASTNGLLQNLGTLRANAGTIEFSNGMDAFGGDLMLENGSTASVLVGTTTMTRVRTSLDSDSTFASVNNGRGAATLTFNGIVDNAGGTLLANSDAAGAATFNLSGVLVDDGGTLRSDGGVFAASNLEIEESGVLALQLRNSGTMSLTNVASTAGTIAVDWTGTGGALTFNNYRSEGATTLLNLAGWSGDGGSLTISGGTNLETAGFIALASGAVLSVTGAGSRLVLPTATSSASTSVVDLVSGGRLAIPDLAVGGDLRLRGGRVEGNVHLASTGTLAITSGSNTIDGDLSWDGDQAISISANSVNLSIGGEVNVAPGSSMELRASSARFFGAGNVTNSGLILGGPTGTNQSTFFDLSLTNNADGIVRAFQNGAATDTLFRIRGSVNNAGLMEADGATLYFEGASVINSGTLRTTDNAARSRLIFVGGSSVTDQGGVTDINGAQSRLEVSGGSNVDLGMLTLADGASGFVSGAGSVLTSNSVVEIGASAAFDVASSSRLNAAGLLVNGGLSVRSSAVINAADLSLSGDLTIQSSAVVNAAVVVNPTGSVIANSSVGTFNGAMSILRGATEAGLLSIQANSARVNGTGTITNSGLIRGGGTSNNTSTYLNLNLINNADGVVRAFRNGTPTNTLFRLTGTIDNAGIMEADGARLYFEGANVTNRGTLRTVAGDVASSLQFFAGARVVDDGGTTQIGGALDRLEVSGGSDVHLGTLTLANGASGFVETAGSFLRADNVVQIGEASSFRVSSSGRFDTPGISLDGLLNLQSSGVVEAPVTVNPTGQILANSSIGSLNGDVTVLRDGGGAGRISLVSNSARLNGIGLVTNSGLIEGGGTSNNTSTYFDLSLTNNADGVVRAFRNGTATNTFFQITNDVQNSGVMEAVGANLYFNTATGQNAGLLRAVDNAVASKLIFVGGTRLTDAGGATGIDGALSRLEVSGAANVELGALSFTNGGGGFISGAGSVVTARNVVPLGEASQFSVVSSGRLNAVGVDVHGDLILQSNGVVDAATTVSPTGQIIANSSTGTLSGSVTVDRDATDTGRISLVTNSARLNGSAAVTNNGLIEGGGTSNNVSTHFNLSLTNEANGVVRAFRNGTPTNTFFQITETVQNNGLMEAVGANLYFNTANLTNAGVLRTVDDVAVSKLIFVGGSRVTDAGGMTQIDGALNRLEVSGTSNVNLGALSFTNGGGGFVSGAGSVVAATNVVPISETSRFSVVSSGRFDAPGIDLGGELVLQSSTVVNAPVTVLSTGRITANSGLTSLNDDVTVLNDGGGGIGHVSVVASSARIAGTGTIFNHGVVEGGTDRNNGLTRIDNDIVNESDGMVRAFADASATSNNFQIFGDVTNRGTLQADAATLSLSSSFVDNDGGTLSAINGGRVLVTGSFVGGSSGSDATIDGDASLLDVATGSLVGLDSLNLINGGDARVRDTNSVLAIASSLNVGVDSVATAGIRGRLQATDFNIDGTLAGQGGTVLGDVHIGATGSILATTSTTTIDGDVTTTSSGSLISVTGSGTQLRVEGAINNAADATMSVNTNSTSIAGPGTITNAGLIEGGGLNNNNTSTISKPLINNGEVVARRLGTSTGTTLQFNAANIMNSGSMTASGVQLLITGSTVDNSGLFRAENDSLFTLQSSAVVNNLGGGVEVDGDGSAFRVLSRSDVSVASMIITDGGDVTVNNATLDVASPFTTTTGSVVTVENSGVLNGPGVTVNGIMNAGRSTVTAPTTVGPTGDLFVRSSSTATFNAPITIQTDGGANSGALHLLGNNFRLGGTGNIVNGGLIEGGGTSTNSNVFINKDIINDGVVRAIQNGAAVNSSLQLDGNITNNGAMEASGGNLFLTGASVNNNGVVRAVDHAAGSRVIVSSGTTISDLGGFGEVDGAASSLEISGAATATFGTLTVTNAGAVSVTGAGSRLSGSLVTAAGTSVSATTSSAIGIDAGGLSNGGTLSVSGGAGLAAAGAVVNESTGTIDLDGTGGFLFQSSLTNNGNLDLNATTVDIDGDLAFGAGAMLAASAGAVLRLSGDFANAVTAPADFASQNLALNLDASFNVADALRLEVASADVGALATGGDNNFGLGALRVTGADEFVILVDDFDNPLDGSLLADALYVSELTIADPDSRLTLNGFNVYYGVFIGDLSQIDLSGGGSLTQVDGLAIAPEPGTLVLLLMGFGISYRRRRRQG